MSMKKTIRYINEGNADSSAFTNLINLYDRDKNFFSHEEIEVKPRHRKLNQLLSEIKKPKYSIHDYLILIVDKDDNKDAYIEEARKWAESNKDKNLFILSNPSIEIWFSCLLGNCYCNRDTDKKYDYSKAHCDKEFTTCPKCLKPKVNDIKDFKYSQAKINIALDFQKNNNWHEEPSPFTNFNKLVELLKNNSLTNITN